MAEIKSIQFKRGNKSALETKLVGDNKPKKGEPIWELDSNLMKLGDGEHDYADLPYLNDSTTANNLVTDGYLLKDATHDVWYKDAAHSSILVKWKNRLYRDLTVDEDGEPGNVMYFIDNGGESLELIRMANARKAGLVKLYGNSGQNTDGTMTQKAITDAIDGIVFENVGEESDAILNLKKPW